MKSLPASRSVFAVVLGSSLAISSATPPVSAQPQNPANSGAAQTLLENAHLLESRGRLDMAAQTWQQVLLSDPNNTEALAGLARAAKVSGDTALSNSYLERLRAINPNDPGIARAEKVTSDQGQAALLQQAGKFAQAGQYAQAMAIYRKVFAKEPPTGDWALAYYETEAATEEGRPHAIAGLHALIEKNPTESRYQIALGRILTYNPKTRVEGRHLLERHPDSPQAVEALRQSLVWDSASPASAPDIRAFLAKHNDAELAKALHDMPAGKPSATRGAAGASPQPPAPPSPEVLADRKAGVEMEQAYKALNAKHLEDAEARFKAILSTSPDSARALAGLGYIRMQQSNFGSAVSFLEQARQNGAKDPGLDSALQTARFWTTMGDAATALNENDLTTAGQQYQAALQLKPNSPEATEGLAGTLLKAQQNGPAAELFERVVKVRPNSPPAWRGLFQSYYNLGSSAQALQVEHRIPAAIHAQLMRDPDFLRALASAFSAVGRDADAQRVLRTALDLPFAPGSGPLKIGTELQYASLLQAANHLDQAAGLYRQVLGADPANSSAWQGLVRVQHAMHADAQALQTLASMPLSVRDAAMRDTGFESTVASIEQATNHLDSAQSILEHVVTQDAAANQKPSIGLELQLAGLYLARNNTAQAYPIYRQILADNPDRADAWKGILTALHTAGRDQEALAQIQQVPASLRGQLELDPEYLQTMGAVYNALGQPEQAAVFINRVQQHYSAQNTAPPADIDIQDAWLLFNSGNDSGLYRQLMLLGSRPDLSDEQRRTVQTIWTNWAVRRANQTAAAGAQKRSLAILNASAKAFPDNPGVLRALASGYARAGLPKQAVLIFKSQDMTAATSADYKAAVGAALASGDQKSAETWLRYGLDAYPRDAEMLKLGAKFEQAHGNSGRAADYFRASLAAEPPSDPGAELAGELSLPSPSRAGSLPGSAQSKDLATLLGETVASTPDALTQQAPAARPYLPSYNNVSGQAPVDLAPGTYTSGTAVPSYMTNSTSRTSALPPASRTGRLRDYAPQASTQTSLPIQPASPDAYTPSLDRSPQTAYNAPQVPVPVSAPTLRAATAPSIAPPPDPLALAPPAVQRVSPEDLYGASAGLPAPTNTAGYTPAPVPVQLGSKGNVVAPAQTEVTDVLPTSRYLPGSPFKPDAQAASTGTGEANDIVAPETHNAQFTAQTDSADPFGQQYPQPDLDRPRSPSTPTRRRRPSSTPTPAPRSRPPAPTRLPQTPPALSYPNIPAPLSSNPYPALRPAAPEGTPPSDADLVAKSLPPLRGSFDPASPGGTVPVPKTEREQTEQELASLEASYSSWIGGTGSTRYRSGTPGFDRLVDIEAPVEASGVLGKTVRATVIPRPVFLNSGVVDPTLFANLTGVVPVLGTTPGNAATAPAQQFASGIGGEIQLTTTNLGLAAGYTPYSFLVANITARARWRLGHITLFGDRDSVKDTQLSYAGIRDPGSISGLYDGNIWGGVISTTGGARLDVGNEKSGFFLSADGGTLTGFHVLDNKKEEGTMGAYFRVHNWPGYGNLNVGGNFYGMHYDHNERGLTYGQGGYFSPNVYFLASLPVTYTGAPTPEFHYTVVGSVGVQTFQENSAAYFPLDRAIQIGSQNRYYPLNSDTGLNYSLNAEGSYRIADHWYVGGFGSANNSRNYNTVNGGFYVRYLFRQQVLDDNAPTGLFPVSGFRPLRVP